MRKAILGLWLSAMVCGPAWAEDCGGGRTMLFERFMHREFPVDVPLRIYVPSEYDYVELELKQAVTAYWMKPGQEKVLDADPDGAVPGGYLFGIWSRTITYDSKTKTFLGLDELFEQIKADKKNELTIERADNQGHDLLFVELAMPGKVERTYSAFIDMNRENAVFMVNYVPPEGDRAHSECVWRNVKAALKGD
ncbi:MAG: hypothetical protein KA144_15605 [Xanthomonadaceae bacterium]|nr:hypothetical protein [Xanthomonadaceae bacterium]